MYFVAILSVYGWNAPFFEKWFRFGSVTRTRILLSQENWGIYRHQEQLKEKLGQILSLYSFLFFLFFSSLLSSGWRVCFVTAGQTHWLLQLLKLSVSHFKRENYFLIECFEDSRRRLLTAATHSLIEWFHMLVEDLVLDFPSKLPLQGSNLIARRMLLSLLLLHRTLS